MHASRHGSHAHFQPRGTSHPARFILLALVEMRIDSLNDFVRVRSRSLPFVADDVVATSPGWLDYLVLPGENS